MRKTEKQINNNIFDSALYDNKVLLDYCPNYESEKLFVQSLRIISWEEIHKYINENYQLSNIYEIKKSLNFSDGVILSNEVMKEEVTDLAKVKYGILKDLYEQCKTQIIKLYDLVNYIVNYPSTWPIPKEEELNFELETLMQKYDIIVRYYIGIDGLQICGDTIKRLVMTIQKYDKDLKDIIRFMNIADNYLNFKSNRERMLEMAAENHQFFEFPLSYAQKKGESLWQEGRSYQMMHVFDFKGNEEGIEYVMRLKKIMNKNK